MGFKEQVEQILQNRKTDLEKVKSDEQNVQALQNKLDDIEAFLRKSDSNDIKMALPDVLGTKSKLNVVAEKIRIVKKRFSRNTVNIGVSGAVHVGKSTLIQCLTGLNDKQIPTGAGGPVTACRSRIFNLPQGKEGCAIVYFYTDKEFLEKRIFPVCDGLPYQITSLADFLQTDFTAEYGSEDPLATEKNKKNDKLQKMQSTYRYYSSLLNKSELRIEHLEELYKYVSYTPELKDCLFWAVKAVDIYCHFPALDDVDVQLIDLPGFGEIGGVDKIALEGLETEVDHAVVLLRPSPTAGFVGQEYANMTRTLYAIQRDVKDRKNLMSYALNKVKGQPDVEQSCNSLKSELIKNDKTVDATLNLYEIDAKDTASVSPMFGSILNRMITALPAMDNDFLVAYKSQLGFDEIKENLKTVLDNIKQSLKAIQPESSQLWDKAEEMRERLAGSYAKLLCDYEPKSENEVAISVDEHAEAVDEIRNSLDQRIEENLCFTPNNVHGSWESFAGAMYDVRHGFASVYEQERNRLRILLLNEYGKLNQLYEKKINSLKEAIVDAFRKETGNFVDPSKKWMEALDSIIDELEDVGLGVEPLIDAFKWIKDIRLDFRQNVYPSIVDSDEMKELRKSQLGKSCPSERDKGIQYVRNQLKVLCLEVNDSIRNKILTDDITNRFIRCALENFDDLLVRNDEDKNKKAFNAFVNAFSERIMPESNTSAANAKSLRYLKKNIESILSGMDAIQNA